MLYMPVGEPDRIGVTVHTLRASLQGVVTTHATGRDPEPHLDRRHAPPDDSSEDFVGHPCGLQGQEVAEQRVVKRQASDVESGLPIMARQMDQFRRKVVTQRCVRGSEQFHARRTRIAAPIPGVRMRAPAVQGFVWSKEWQVGEQFGMRPNAQCARSLAS